MDPAKARREFILTVVPAEKQQHRQCLKEGCVSEVKNPKSTPRDFACRPPSKLAASEIKTPDSRSCLKVDPCKVQRGFTYAAKQCALLCNSCAGPRSQLASVLQSSCFLLLKPKHMISIELTQIVQVLLKLLLNFLGDIFSEATSGFLILCFHYFPFRMQCSFGLGGKACVAKASPNMAGFARI